MAGRAAILVLCSIAGFGCESGRNDYRHQFHAFGTIVTIDIFEATSRSNAAAADALHMRIQEIDANWYPWRDGELRRINTAIANGMPVEVSASLAELIRRAAELEQKSGGRFNPGIGHLTELWGFHDIALLRASPPDDHDILAWRSLSISSSSLSWDGNILHSDSTSLMLDLGGIAKGAILQQFVDVLRAVGVDNAIIDIGGDLIVMGQVDGRPAKIGIRSPRADAALAWLDVFDGETTVTSGDYERYFEHDGKRYQHVLDPRTGYPVRHTISSTVVHGDPVLADAAATALLVGGPEEFEVICGVLGLELALIVTASGDLRLTHAMEKRLNWLNREQVSAGDVM